MRAGREFFAVLVVAVTCLLATPGTLLAQTTETPVVPDPAECTVEPRDAASLAALSGTPEPRATVESEADLPQGPAADADTLAAVTAAERLLIACLNAGSFAHVLALVTDHVAVQLLSGPPSQELIDRILRPATPTAAADRVSLITVRDARTLGEERVGVIVEWGMASAPDVTSQVVFHAFIRVQDSWLLDEEIANLPVPPTPAASPTPTP